MSHFTPCIVIHRSAIAFGSFVTAGQPCWSDYSMERKVKGDGIKKKVYRWTETCVWNNSANHVFSNIEGMVTTGQLTKPSDEVGPRTVRRPSTETAPCKTPSYTTHLSPQNTQTTSNHHCPLNLTSKCSERRVFAEISKPKRILLPSFSEKDIVK